MLRRRDVSNDDREHQQQKHSNLHLRSGGGDDLVNNGQQHLPDPFSLDLNIEPRDWPGIMLGSVLLAPWRAVLVLLLMVLAWVACKVALIGVPPGAAGDAAPRKGWRRWVMDHVYASFGWLVLAVGGFRVRIKGQQADRADAPLLVGGPHSSFLEALLIVMCAASPVSRHENKDAILISTCQRLSQTIFVDRRTSATRRDALEAICERARSKQDWPQVFIFPEGTNTNRRLLLKFKAGAFAPGVPVQPVLIRYGGCERVDPVTWTFKQSHSYLVSVWLMLARPLKDIEVEFLPVYSPSPEEIEDPALFAKNVQVLMAKGLGIPATEITYHEYYKEQCRKNGTDIKDEDDKKKG